VTLDTKDKKALSDARMDKAKEFLSEMPALPIMREDSGHL